MKENLRIFLFEDCQVGNDIFVKISLNFKFL